MLLSSTRLHPCCCCCCCCLQIEAICVQQLEAWAAAGGAVDLRAEGKVRAAEADCFPVPAVGSGHHVASCGTAAQTTTESLG
jgi:hypothetical protein